MTQHPCLRCGGVLKTLLSVMILLGAFEAPLWAADHGQIAVIPDTTGKILPATTLGCGVKYPNTLCVPQAGLAFYASHPDAYDMLVFFTTKPISATEKSGYPLVADVQGIGQDSTPWSYKDFGSKGRLIHGVTLGSLSSMPDDPEGIFGGGIPISGLEIAGHEIGHHWLAYANVNHGDGNLDILRGHYSGTDQENTITHWSCWFNSNSVMYGGMLTDNQDGTFTDINGLRKYSQLDQYLMGLRRPDEVEPMFYVKVGYSIYGCPDWPKARGVAHSIEGERVDFPIDDVIRALGSRKPAASPCHYKVAFGLVHNPANPPTEAELAKVERYRAQLETWYAAATDGRGSLDTRLDGCGTGTATCPGQPSAQCGAAADGDVVDSDDSDTGKVCPPGVRRCSGDTLEECKGDGSAWQTVETCPPGNCQGDACVQAESEADGDTQENEAPVDNDEESPDSDRDTERDAAEEGDASSAEQDRDTFVPPVDKGGQGSGCQENSGALQGWLLLFALAFGFARRSSRAF